MKRLLQFVLCLLCFTGFSESWMANNALYAQSILDQADHYFDFYGRSADVIGGQHLVCEFNCPAGMTPTIDKWGNLEGALAFDDAAYSKEFPTAFSGDLSFAFELRLDPSTPSRRHYLLDTRTSASDANVHIAINTVTDELEVGIGTNPVSTFPLTMVRNRNYNLVFAIDGSTGVTHLYVNGTRVNVVSTNWTALTGASDQLTVGGSILAGSTSSENLEGGVLDEMRIWRRTLTAAQAAYVADVRNAQPDYLLHHVDFDGQTHRDNLSEFRLVWNGSPGNNNQEDRDGNAQGAIAPAPGGYLASPPTFSGKSSFTYAVWAKFTDATASGWKNFFDMRYNNKLNCPAGSVNLTTDVISFPSNQGRVSYTFTPTFNTWQHFAFVQDVDNNVLEIYVDGVKLTNTTWTNSAFTGPTTQVCDGIVHFNGRNRSGNDYFPGNVDDLYVYTRALDATEIAELAGVNTDTEAPSPVSNLGFTITGANSARVEWDAATDNVGVTEYIVLNNNDVEYTRTTNLFWENTNINQGFPYTHKVIAVDAAGNQSPERRTTVFISNSDTQAPTAPGAITFTDIEDTNVTYSWAASTDNVGVAEYEYDVLPAGQSVNTAMMQSAGTNLSTSFIGLQSGTNYVAYVRALDAAGNASALTSSAFTTDASSDTQAPTAPGNLALDGVTPTSATFSWSAATDNVGVMEYRATVTAPGGLPISDFSVGLALTYTLGSRTPGTSYDFHVRAVDAAGNASPYTILNFTTPSAGDTQAPSAPTDVTTTQQFDATNTRVTRVDFTASTDNVGVVGYDYEVTLVSSGAVEQTGSTVPTSRGFSLAGLEPFEDYSVSIVARDAAGNTSTAAVATFTTDDTERPSDITGITQFQLFPTIVNHRWDASTDNVGVVNYTYQVVTRGAAAPTGGTIGGTSNGTGGLLPSTDYTAYIYARDAQGNRSNPGIVDFTTPAPDTESPVMPSPIMASMITDNSFMLTWDSATDNYQVLKYYITESTTGLVDSAAHVIGRNEVEFSFSSLAANTLYQVEVEAVDIYGNRSAARNIDVTTTGASSTTSLAAAGYDVFPNPMSSDVLTVRGPEAIERVVLTDMLGRVQLSLKPTSDQVQVGDLPAGTYVLTAYDKTGEMLGITQVVR